MTSRVLTSLSESDSLPRSVSEVRQVIAEHEGQVSSVVIELTLDSELNRLLSSASQLGQHRDVRLV